MQAVILTAISDACDTRANGRRATLRDEHRRAALKWFTDADTDFEGVCELAGLHPHTVRKFALAYINSRQSFPRIHRQTFVRNHNPLCAASIAARAGVSPSAVQGVLKHDKGSEHMKDLVRRSLRELVEQQALAA